jgi:chemotaxis protein CheC
VKNLEKIVLNDSEKDALQELANIGAGHASTALSQMINRDVKMGIPKVEVISINEVSQHIESEKVVVGVFLKISDEIPSYVVLFIPRKSAFSLADMLLGTKNDPKKEVLSEMDKSALNEVGNVMICAFFDSLSELLQLSIIPGPPNLAYDIPNAVLDYILIQIGQISNEVIFFNVDLKEEEKDSFKIDMYLMPEPKSIDIILEKVGMKR